MGLLATSLKLHRLMLVLFLRSVCLEPPATLLVDSVVNYVMALLPRPIPLNAGQCTLERWLHSAASMLLLSMSSIAYPGTAFGGGVSVPRRRIGLLQCYVKHLKPIFSDIRYQVNADILKQK
jgi:hypothetical protein